MIISGVLLFFLFVFAGLGLIFAMFLIYILITGKKKEAMDSAKSFGVESPIEVK